MIYEMVNKLWKEGKNVQETSETYFKYARGKQKNSLEQSDVKTSPLNIIKQIVDSKVGAILDNSITLTVLPSVKAFDDLSQIKYLQAYSDVLDICMKDVIKESFDSIKETIVKKGLIQGFSPVQTYYDKEKSSKGEICIKPIDVRSFRWDKAASDISNATFVAYSEQVSPFELKNRFAKLPEGDWDFDKIQLIDTATKSFSSKDRGNRKGGIFSYQNEQGAGQQYAYSQGSSAVGEHVELVTMYFLDDSLYAPEKTDTESKLEDKEEMAMKYPYGRCVYFIPESKEKTVLDDIALPKSFQSLGAIDIFKPYAEVGRFKGDGDVESLIPIQDRIDAAFFKLRQLIAKYVSIICLEKGVDLNIQENDLVNQFVVYFEGLGRGDAKLPPVLTNNTLGQIDTVIKYIEFLINHAYSIARVNETMINGIQQKGTTSGEQVDALQESPMTSIRLIQKNLKETLIKVAEKILINIKEYYSDQRIITLNTGFEIDGKNAVRAMFGTDAQGDQSISYLDQMNMIVAEFKIKDDWEFKVDVVAGTEIPRSRRENAALMSQLFQNGTLGDPNNIDIKEQYLRSMDVPNYREFIAIEKNKQKQAMADAQKNPKPMYMTVLQNPDLSKAVTEMIKALDTNSNAKAQLLIDLGFKMPQVDKVEDAPAQAITSKSDFRSVSAAVPEVVSNDPQKSAESQQVSAKILDKELDKGGHYEI